MSGYIFPSLRGAQINNGEMFKPAVCVGSPSVVYATGSVSASTDPFSGKTNKYAESKLVSVIASAASHVKFAASSTACTTSDFYIAANVINYFVVADGAAFLTVLPTTGSASFWATEIY